MPSLAQGYGQGLLLGLQLQERQRRMKQGELEDEFLRERVADIRWQREKDKKSLLARVKEEEAQRAMKRFELGEKYTEVTPDIIEKLGLPLRGFMPGATIKPTGTTVPIKGEPLDIVGKLMGWEKLRKPETKPSKGLLQRTKKLFKDRETEEKELRSYEKKFRSGWATAKKEADYKNEREYYHEYFRETVPVNLRHTLGLRLGLTERTTGKKGFEKPEAELPSALIGELQEFDTFDEWYNNLSSDAQEELDVEPETLKAIRDWYAVSR